MTIDDLVHSYPAEIVINFW